MLPIDRCPICGGEVAEKEVTEIVRSGGNTATLKVNAKVCVSCGERFYHLDIIKKFEEIKTKLEHQETEEFQPVGRSFEVA